MVTVVLAPVSVFVKKDTRMLAVTALHPTRAALVMKIPERYVTYICSKS